MLALSASAYEEHKLNLKKDEVSPSKVCGGYCSNYVNSSGTSELGMHAYQAPYVMDIHSIPVKPVPEATSTAFHDVPPKLESAADAQQTYRVVRDAIVSQAYAYHCFSDWRINAAVMVTGEELEIHVAVMRVVPSNCIRVDFHLLQGDEMQFLYAVTTIQKQCRAIDMRHLGGPDSRRNVTLPQWSLRSDEFTTSSSLAE
ncbi:hypothetical protein Poli38472_003588 [Pythium oligandrum]|uniref:Uncharacterized protein n=1 Tax=Pythium oligandrum TaxID=41045 RepID=A0A8K1CMW2_PYTOL|nr:hypothetical protein Poli38472_003588 [Pythium oligandrum]|eukprot:TMW65823.1 hypothetical protein Poli38472_003588 [Pythium oligandrum]